VAKPSLPPVTCADKDTEEDVLARTCHGTESAHDVPTCPPTLRDLLMAAAALALLFFVENCS
jgi:hypothetical protein